MTVISSSSLFSNIIERALQGFFSCWRRKRRRRRQGGGAMVNKIWCRKLSCAWCWNNNNNNNERKLSELPNARLFSEPKCQKFVGLWYIYYRSIITILWMSIIVCSIFEVGSKKPRGKNYLWPIYLTNWDLLFGLGQSVLAFIIVKRRWNIEKNNANFDANNNLSIKKIEKFYWFFYTVTLNLAIGVSCSYWILVYNPKDYSIDSLNIMVHVCNSLLIICDFIVTNVPLEYCHFWWSIIIVISYLVFSIIYYIAGGLDKRGKQCIYDSMDWRKPGKTILLSIGALVFLIIVHCLFSYLSIIIKNQIKHNNNNQQVIIENSHHHMEIV